jgi:ABC-type branched-subunit amino acid transport system ATPase component
MFYLSHSHQFVAVFTSHSYTVLFCSCTCAEQTTLIDVIALRKGPALSFQSNVGITGDVLLNGFPQEKISFKRCSGYVEQFDIQSSELTVRETIRFSAQLRLDRTNPIHDSPDGLERHIDQIIETLGLTREADFLVGSDEASGLTFEQKKRLSIAVELAASPSIIALDEPTSGEFFTNWFIARMTPTPSFSSSLEKSIYFFFLFH